jgi:hypothetical protein
MTVKTSTAELKGFTRQESDAVFAGLRLLASNLQNGRVRPDDGDIGAILTSSGDHAGLSAEQVHDLCDLLLEGV